MRKNYAYSYRKNLKIRSLQYVNTKNCILKYLYFYWLKEKTLATANNPTIVKKNLYNVEIENGHLKFVHSKMWNAIRIL